MVQMGDITIQDEAVILPAATGQQFTFDMTTATGNIAYTGIGFRPRMIFFWATIGAASTSIFGATCGVGNFFNCVTRDNQLETSDSFQVNSSSCISSVVSSGNEQSAFLITFDVDGFTLGWLKSGSPTGTLVVRFQAYK